MKMNKIGFIIPNYENERRVALLPEDVKYIKNNIIIIEENFGSSLGIPDFEYSNAGCEISTREEIFKNCDIIFSLKLIQESDYEFIREGQIILGWTHPNGSGKDFMLQQAIPKKLVIIDLDNIAPKIYYKYIGSLISEIPRNFTYANSLVAGYASTLHALTSYGLIPNNNTKVAVLSSGNVSQGAYQIMSKLGADVRMFYRKTMNEFLRDIDAFDIIINGIEVYQDDEYIINKEQFDKIKKGSLLIDAAADAGNAIYGTKFTTHKEPIIDIEGIKYYCINNSPTVFYRTASKYISKTFTEHVYSLDFDKIISKYV